MTRRDKAFTESSETEPSTSRPHRCRVEFSVVGDGFCFGAAVGRVIPSSPVETKLAPGVMLADVIPADFFEVVEE
jgi:hypothetical protein